MSLVSGLDSCKITPEFCGLAFHEKPVGYATATTLSLDFNTDLCLGSKFTVKVSKKLTTWRERGPEGWLILMLLVQREEIQSHSSKIIKA